MKPPDLRRLVDALGDEHAREAAARALAQAVPCAHLLLLVKDPRLDVLLPAPGMTKTLAAGPAWRDLLRRCLEAGGGGAAGGTGEAGDVGTELGGVVDVMGGTWQARAVVHGHCAAVLLDSDDPPVPAALREALPLLCRVLQAQQALRVGRADAEQARQAAARAQQLTVALDTARAAATDLNLKLRAEHQHKDEFLAMLAHELRNPLAPIVTGIEILRRAPPDDTALRDRQLTVMSRQMKQLTHLVDDLLDVSRVSRGLIELRREALRLDEVIDAAVDASLPLIRARGHVLEVPRAAAPLHVDGDRVRLVQVFSNLLNNAAKYTDPGGRIVVQVAVAGDQAEVEVSDTGIGIPPESLDTIFDLFAQVPGAVDRAPGGLGLGLTLVRSLVQLHGGQVRARSAGRGHGSTFLVRLPLLAEQPQPAAAPRAGPVATRCGIRVLVVDDNVDAAETLAEVLRMNGADVTVAHDGGHALQVGAGADPPELVLLDIGLPGMDGYETAREWRRRFGSRARLVALTGYGSAEDRRRTAHSGFDAHLVKPVDLAVIEALLGPPAADRAAPA